MCCVSSVVLAFAVCDALGYNWVLGCSVVLAYAVCDVLGYKRGAWLFGCLGCSVFGAWLGCWWVFGCCGLFNLWCCGLGCWWVFGCCGLFNLWCCGLGAPISSPCSIGLALGWVWYVDKTTDSALGYNRGFTSIFPHRRDQTTSTTPPEPWSLRCFFAAHHASPPTPRPPQRPPRQGYQPQPQDPAGFATTPGLPSGTTRWRHPPRPPAGF